MNIKDFHTNAATTRGKKIVFTSAAAVLCSVAVATFLLFPSARAMSLAKAPSSDAASTNADMSKSAATVNGVAISEAELASMTSQGVDRAVAIDRYVNKVLAADLARKTYAADAEVALRGAEREVLAQLYISKRTQDLTAAIKAEDIKAFYDKNVKAEDYALFKVRFLVTQDPKEADAVVSALAGGKVKEVDSMFKAVKDGDGFTPAQELPYGLGQVVRGMKAGDFSRPIVLRNGVFVLRVDEVKPGQRPEQVKVETQIKELIIAQRLNDEITGLRRQARIELK